MSRASMFKFLHAADLHLDSPLNGLDQYEGAPVEAIRQATRRALENLVRLAIDEQVAFVVIAGDIYDGDWRDYNTGLFFRKEMSKLGHAGIPVYMISGNHDAERVMSKKLPLADNVYLFATDRAETVIHEPTGTALHGQGFATKAVVKDLSAAYPAARGGLFNIGVLHTCASGLDGHERYAPCSVEGLCDLGYDYWALGHVHARQFLLKESPVIAFSGNVQGRHIRETGPKGCLLVEVEQGRPRATFRALDVFRWADCEVGIDDCETADDVTACVVEKIGEALEDADGRPLAARITLRGACEAHGELIADRDHWEQELRSRLTHETREQVWIEKIRVATKPPGDDEPAIGEGPLAELRRLVADLGQDEELRAILAGELSDLGRKLPREVREELLAEFDGASGLDDPRWLDPIAREAGEMLLGRMKDGERGR